MIQTEQIKQLAEEALKNTDRFLVHCKVSADNVINVVIDSDSGVSIQHCIDLSRYIEHKLDREQEDFELKVLSAGLEFPFAMLRQYKKYIGKRISLFLNDGHRFQGVLLEAEEDHVLLQEEIEKKIKKKTKIEQGEILRFPLSEVQQAKAVIKI